MSTPSLRDFLSSILYDTNSDVNYVFCALNVSPGSGTPWPPITDSRMLELVKKYNKSNAFYISTMIAKADETGKFRNKQSAFEGLSMIVLDDVGTKVDPNNVKPTYKIETSEGNYQYGYVFEEPIWDRNYAEQLVSAIYETPLTDGGGKMVNKFVRLPAGINGKELPSGERNTFPVTLTEFNETFFTPEDLLQGFGIELEAPALPTIIEPGTSITLSEEDYRKVKDPVTAWLASKGLILAESDDWLQVVCPWHESHTDGVNSASYSPVGNGSMPEHRAFNCFHDHCNEKKTIDFLQWIKDQGGPWAAVFDPIAPLTSRYVLLEHSSEVADTWANANSIYPIVSLASFRAAHKQFIRGERGAKQYYGELWLESKDTIRTKGRVFDPKEPPVLCIEDVPYFNTYRAPRHESNVTGEPQAYLDHIEWLIPDETERTIFHDWIAAKLQFPETRSYALIMVADKLEGETGEIYGTGRSTVGDILGRVFQSGVVKIDLTDITGRGDSQAAYNDWADGSLLCIVEETKEEISSYNEGHASYEGLKKLIDVRPIPGQRVKPKYGRIYSTTLYTNFLFFSNHSDAIQLPEGDRRFCVLQNAKGRRSYEEYEQLQAFLRNPEDIARLYKFYLERDIAEFNRIYPIMTPAKQRMIRQSITTLDEVWQVGLESLPGAVVTKKQLTDACAAACDNDIQLIGKASNMVRARWRKLAEVCPKWRLKDEEGQFQTIRIIKDHEQVAQAFAEKDLDYLRTELKKNQNETFSSAIPRMQAIK